MKEKIDPRSHIGEIHGIYRIDDVSEEKDSHNRTLYKGVCTQCGHIRYAPYSKFANKSEIVTTCTHQKKEIKIKKCLNCGEEIPINGLSANRYEKRKFCSTACRRQYTKKEKKHKFCINCGKELNRFQEKYCSNDCQRKYEQKQWEEKWLSGEISGFYETNHWGGIPDRIRTYLFNKYENKCAVCGWGETNHYTGRIPLEVEHIDGNYKNNRPENLTLLCPNCHSLTKTYRGANKGNGRGKTWTPAENN